MKSLLIWRRFECRTRSLHTTPDGASSSASRSAYFGPACVSSIVGPTDHAMQHPVIQKYIGELVKARYPYFTSETQVICGRVTLTAMPSIESAVVHSFRLDMPADVQPSESPYWLLFLVSVWDAKVASEIVSRVHRGDEHSEVIGAWRLRVFVADGHPVFLAEATSSPKV
jgi:hypothetical protein